MHRPLADFMNQTAPCAFVGLLPRLAGLLLCILCGGTAAPSHAQTAPQDGWPGRPIRVVVPFSAGGGSDMVARAFAQSLSAQLGQPIVIENKPGAATVIGTQSVVQAAPDGYTLLLSGSTSFSINPALRKRLPYNPSRDLAPIAIVARTSLALVAGHKTPWRSLPELIAAARAHPGRIRFGTFGTGSGPHLAGEMFAMAAGIRLQDIPYSTTSQLVVALNSGEVDLGIEVAGALAPQVQAGRMRALAVLGSERSSVFPEVRTLAEQGLGEATFKAWFGLAAPARTPASVIDRLSHAVAVAAGDPEVQAALRAQDMEPMALGPAAFRQEAEHEISRYRAEAVRAGISLD
jgi:tripartite-type tricarboxylate transporter receptor subunit TctC